MTLTQYGDELTLPKSIRERYGLKLKSPVRIIETREGILLIPLTSEPMEAELVEEIKDWQALSEESWLDASEELSE
jgi:bifunctional DNA-binding transcriptional regulator/antitoxin component of YhaV-PrlF toxin-antitoxin module